MIKPTIPAAEINPGSAGRLSRHDGRPRRGDGQAITNLSSNGFVNSKLNWAITFDCIFRNLLEEGGSNLVEVRDSEARFQHSLPGVHHSCYHLLRLFGVWGFGVWGLRFAV